MATPKHIKYVYVLLCIALIPACEMAIDLDDPYPGNRLVINGLINPDSAVKVSITESRSVLDEDIWHYYRGDGNWTDHKEPYYKPVRGATVRLYEGDVLVATLTEDTLDTYVSNFHPKAKAEYRLEVGKDGFPTAIATTTIPEINAEILDLNFEILNKRTQYIEFYISQFEYGSYEANSYELLAHLDFTDNTGEDYYEVQIGEEYFSTESHWGDTVTYKISGPYLFFHQLESEDIIYAPYVDTDYYIHRVFNDQLFQQESKTISFTTTASNHFIREFENVFGVVIHQNFHIQLRNLSYDYYSYFSSLALQIRSEKNPFSEPVQTYSNVDGGYGIFAGYNAQVKKFPIPFDSW